MKLFKLFNTFKRNPKRNSFAKHTPQPQMRLRCHSFRHLFRPQIMPLQYDFFYFFLEQLNCIFTQSSFHAAHQTKIPAPSLVSDLTCSRKEGHKHTATTPEGGSASHPLFNEQKFLQFMMRFHKAQHTQKDARPRNIRRGKCG